MKSLFLFAILTCLIFSSAAMAQPGFNPPINQPINFPDTDVGNTSRLGLTVTGRGQMWNIQFVVNIEDFSVEPAQRNVGAREAFEFELRFTPQRAGQIQGIMTITAVGQDGNVHAFEVELNGIGIGEDRPEITLNLEEVLFEIETPEHHELITIRISNTGNEVLETEWELEDVAWLYLQGDRRQLDIEPEDDWGIGIRTRFDFPENGEYDVNFTINSNDPERPEIVVPITMIVNIPEVTTQTLELEQGWNMISTNREFAEEFIDEEGPDMGLIFVDIADQIRIIKDGFGGFCAPTFDYWGIEAWESDRAYQVNTLEETELDATGLLIPWDREIFLHGGWNIVPYYPVYEHWDLGIALADLIERNLLMMAKDVHGRFVMFQDWGWENPPAIPGQGYMVKVTQNCRFSWGPEPERVNGTEPELTEKVLAHFKFDLETDHSSNNMSVVIRNIDVDNMLLDGSEIACFTQDGRIAGAGNFRQSTQSVCMAIWGDEQLTEDIVEGLAIGESLNFRMWDPVRDMEYPIFITPVEGENKYSENGILICEGKIETTLNPEFLPEQFLVTGMYPNPFNSSLTVNYSLFESGDVQIGLYSIVGRLIKHAIQNSLSVGSQLITIDAKNLAAGIYVVRVRKGEKIQLNKVVLMK